jgi:hypothetical protein
MIHSDGFSNRTALPSKLKGIKTILQQLLFATYRKNNKASFPVVI